LRDYSDDGVILVNAFCQKSLVYAARLQTTTWKYRIHRIPQIPRWRILSPRTTIKRVQKLQKRVRHRVCHTDPTRPGCNTACALRVWPRM